MNDTKKLINDGGPAFSCASSMIVNGKQATVPAQGMSLRDYFAGQAIAGIIAFPQVRYDLFDEYARYAYAQADAMLAARERKEDAT